MKKFIGFTLLAVTLFCLYACAESQQVKVRGQMDFAVGGASGLRR